MDSPRCDTATAACATAPRPDHRMAGPCAGQHPGRGQGGRRPPRPHQLVAAGWPAASNERRAAWHWTAIVIPSAARACSTAATDSPRRRPGRAAACRKAVEHGLAGCPHHVADARAAPHNATQRSARNVRPHVPPGRMVRLCRSGYTELRGGSAGPARRRCAGARSLISMMSKSRRDVDRRRPAR